MESKRLADLMTILVLLCLIIATAFLANERGMEASSFTNKIAALEMQIERLKPIPRIEIQRGTVYAGEGEVVIEKVK